MDQCTNPPCCVIQDGLHLNLRRRPRRPGPAAASADHAQPAWAAGLVFAGGLSLLGCWPWGSVLAGFRSAAGARGRQPDRHARRVPVRRWIVAHLDTKAQVQSMAGRLVAVWVIGLAVAALAALSLARLGGHRPGAVRRAAGAGAVLAGALAGRGRLRGSRRARETTGPAWPRRWPRPKGSTIPATGS